MKEVASNKDPEFRKYAVAFIDILGFSEFIRRAEVPSSDESVRLLKLLDRIDESPSFKDGRQNNVFLPRDMELTCRHISDSFVITSPCMAGQKLPALVAVCIKAIQIFQAILSIGFAARGGVAVGNLLVKDQNVFGSSFLSAYDTEKGAKYPRILLHETAEQELQDLCDYKYHRFGFFAESGGETFLDVFFDLFDVSCDSVPPEKRLKSFRDCIEENMRTQDAPAHRDKWIWLARHLNAHLAYYNPTDSVDKINIQDCIGFQINVLNPPDQDWMSPFTSGGHGKTQG
jgi:hypothetical protein